MKRALSDGIEVAFEDSGQGEPALVLIHGAFGNRSHFAPLVARLAERHRVIALDLRGHGESGVPREGFRYADFAQDVLAVCREAGVERAVLSGHSSGGAVALTAAALDPDLAAGVALLDPAVLFPEPLRRQALETLVPALEGPHWLEALRGYFARMFGPFDPPELKHRIMEELAAAPAHMAAPLMREIMSRDFSDELGRSRYPLLFVHARVPADLSRLKQLRPDAILASVAGSGHYVALVVPDQVTAMLDRFLAILPLAVPAERGRSHDERMTSPL
ncbi:MAG TPA: alpha/beta hydrolase [Solirubrobacterales bacterium]|jgi:pimeloyl-ACP methyl ester carboxylesterase